MDERRQAEGRGGILGWFAAHPKTTIALVLLLLLCLTAWLLDAVAETRLQRRIAAIRATGAPVSVDDLNAAIPKIPDDQNMTLMILEHGRRVVAVEIADEVPYMGDRWDTFTGERLPPEQLEAIRRYLAKFPQELAGIHDALKLDQGCWEITIQTPAIGTVLSDLPVFRPLARVLALEVTVAAEAGKRERAGQLLLDLCQLERSLDGPSFLITVFVQFAIKSVAAEQIERVVNQCELSEPVLAGLQAKLETMERRSNFRQAMMTERASFIDTVEWVRGSSTGNLTWLVGGPGNSIPSIVWRSTPGLAALDTSDGLELYDAMVKSIGQPDAKTLRRIRASDAAVRRLAWHHFVSRRTIPSFSRAAELWIRGIAESRALRAGLACERYRLATGDWPETLDDLVPLYLEAVPIDPFDGEPIRYAHIEEGIKVWSIGEDLADGDGDVQRLARQGNARPGDHGWVLLNPDLRGHPAEIDDE